jgi:hypothetical protein
MGSQFGIAVLAALGAVLWQGAAQADDRDFMSVWTGFSASVDSQYAYAGAAYALGGDIDGDGLLARVGLGGGQYRTDGTDSHLVNHYDIDLMLGYRVNLAGTIASLYGGGAFENHDNDDPDADVRGPRLGLKGQAEIYAPLGETFFFSGFGNYSTAFDSFNTSAKLGYRLTDTISLGPEASALGSQDFDQVRAGLASAFRLGDATELAPSAGAAWDFEDEDYGIYGGISLYSRF